MMVLNSAHEVIEALGGAGKAAERLGQKANTVGNWKTRGRIPPEHYLAVKRVLSATDQCAAPEVFGMKSSP